MRKFKQEFKKRLKRSNYLIRFSLVIGMFSFFSSKGFNQCLVDYGTQNYFCDLDSLYLNAIPISGVPPFSFIWETGETTQTIIIPLALGDYMLTMTDATGCVSIINCHIKPYGTVLYYPYNQNACEGDTVTLFLEWFRDSIPGATYLWSTGETTPTIELTDDLVWSVTVTDPNTGCEFVIPPGLFDFHPTPYPEIVGSNILCNGATITLSVNGGPFGTIIWYPGAIYEPTLDVTEPGEYIVWGSSPEAGYCWHQDTIVITEGDIPPPVLTGPPELCAGQTGSISITNYALYEEYLWSNGETTHTWVVNAPGTFTVTVTNTEGCTSSASITVESGGGPDLTTDPTAATCGESNGSIDLTAIPPQSYDFLWSTGATTPDLLNVPPGTYSVTVTDANGCTSTATDIIPDDPIVISINETISPNTSCSVFNGAIDLFITPVGEPYSFQWSNGATTEDISNLAPGNYSVTVTTGLNCDTSETYVVEDISGAAEIISTVIPSTCGESNGSISIQLNGGQAPFSYLWSNGNTTESIAGVPSGTYSVTVTGADGCVSMETIILPNEDPLINISGIVFPNTSCENSNGEIDVTVTPSESYDYIWSNGATIEDLINLSAGTYTLTVTLGVSCIQTASFTVTNENIPFEVSGTTSPNTSCTTPNGSIDLSVSPPATYTYEWMNGATNEDLLNLDTGIYTVTVTNSEGCVITSSFTVETIVPDIDISGIAIANTSCEIPNGIIDISVNPSGTYTFLWSTGSTTEDLQNLSGGIYSVTVTSTDGCTADTSFTIDNQSASFSLSAIPLDNTSCTSPNGALDLSVTPNGAYSYLWSNGAITEDLSSLDGGTYSVTVTDANSCSSNATFTIGNAILYPTITSITNNEICGAGNGGIDITSSPAGNTFLWSNGQTTEDLINIPAGTYSITVTGSNGCAVSDTFNVLNNSNSFSISALPTDNTSCINANGALDLVITPSGSYSYLWSNGATTEDLQSIGAGTYSVTVTDANSCSSTAAYMINDNTSDPIITATLTDETCSSGNGSIDINSIPSGNTYIWSNGSVTEDLVNIPAGIYSITVTGLNGCSASDTFTISNTSNNFSIVSVPVDNNSCVLPNGSIDISITPVGLYNYLWSTGATTEDIQGLSAGTYTVTVTDSFNCSSTASFTLINNTIDPVISETITPAKCGQSNGSINISVTPGSGISFLWSNGSTTEDLINISGGSYSVTVSGSNGCTAIGNYTVPDSNSNFTITAFVSDDQSCINPSGSIDLTVTPVGTYIFEWSNGNTSEDLQNLTSGIYKVTVTDLFNCTTSEIFIIEGTSNPPLIAESIIPATCGETTGAIDLTVIPNSGNSFIWSTGYMGEDPGNLPAGNYSVTVTDANGCTSSGNYTVPDSDPIELLIDADLSSFNTNGFVTCSLQLSVPLSAIDSISWSPAEIMSCYDPLCVEQTFILQQQTQIFVMAMDTNGCMTTANLMLDIDEEYRVYIPNVFSPNNDGPNDKFTVYANDEVEEVVLLEIFDRWGNKVFVNETFPPNEPNYGWNGEFKNKMMNPAVFAYRAVVRFSNGEEHDYKGDVTLIR